MENYNEFNVLDKRSKVNRDNLLGLNDISSITRFYPILSYKDTISNELVGTFQVEPGFFNNNLNFSLDLKFMELYTAIKFDEKSRLLIGKKRLDWGSGLVWNPTLFYTQKDPLRTQNRLEGVYQLNYNHLFDKSDLEFYIFPDSTIAKSKIAVKYNMFGNRSNFSSTYIYSGEGHQLGYDISYGGNQFVLYSEGIAKTYSRRFSINSEGLIIDPTSIKKTLNFEAVLGSSINLSERITGYFEYRYSGDNLNRNEIAAFRNYLPDNLILYDPISMGQHSFFGSVNYIGSYGRWSLNSRGFYDPTSHQLILSPLFIYSLNNLQLELSALAFHNSFAIYDLQSTLLISLSF
jgi:hypothetical protein